MRSKLEPLLKNTNIMQFFLERLGEVCLRERTFFLSTFSCSVASSIS